MIISPRVVELRQNSTIHVSGACGFTQRSQTDLLKVPNIKHSGFLQIILRITIKFCSGNCLENAAIIHTSGAVLAWDFLKSDPIFR
jgi:hypothetical protein